MIYGGKASGIATGLQNQRLYDYGVRFFTTMLFLRYANWQATALLMRRIYESVMQVRILPWEL